MRTEEKKSRKSFKGAVLFTILVVMTILIILMITTIGLASAATKRAYSEYNNRQTTSTARSVVDSVIESLGTNNRDFGQQVIDALRGNPTQPVIVNVNGDGTLGEGYGVVERLEFTYVGKDTDGAGNFYLKGTGDDIIKVTATVTQGGVTSTYSQYVIGDKKSGNHRSSGGGFVAFGGFNGDASDGPGVMAPAYVGINPEPTYDLYSHVYKFYNDSVNKGVLVNSSAELNAGASWKLSEGDGITVMGNFDAGTNELKISNSVALSSSSSVTDIPYLYVGGAFRVQKSEISDPLNIYCGKIIWENNCDSMCANIYCYNTPKVGEAKPEIVHHEGWDEIKIPDKLGSASEEAKTSWSVVGSQGGNSTLIDWVSSLSPAEQASHSALRTGNYYTMGNLYLKNKFNFPGDVFVDGDLYLAYIDNNSDFGGNIYVNGKIEYNDKSSLETVKNKINDGNKFYYNDSKVTDEVKNTLSDKGAVNDGTCYSSSINAFLNGQLKKDNIITNVVNNPGAALAGFQEEVENVKHYKDAINVSQCNVASRKIYSDGLVYNPGDTSGTPNTAVGRIPGTDLDYNIKITDSCTLAGNFDGKIIYIEPSSGDIWINIYKVSMINNCKIIVNDEDGNVNFYMIDSDNYFGSLSGTNKYKVDHFYQNDDYEATLKTIVPGDLCAEQTTTVDSDSVKHKNYFITDNTDIITLAYYTHFKNDNEPIELIKSPKEDADPDNDWMIPGITVYSSETTPVYVDFKNDSIFTGDFYLPNGAFHKTANASSLVKSFTHDITWEGESLKTSSGDYKLQWVGSLVVNRVLGTANKFQLVYVDDPIAGAPGGSSGNRYKWDPIGGYADY